MIVVPVEREVTFRVREAGGPVGEGEVRSVTVLDVPGYGSSSSPRVGFDIPIASVGRSL